MASYDLVINSGSFLGGDWVRRSSSSAGVVGLGSTLGGTEDALVPGSRVPFLAVSQGGAVASDGRGGDAGKRTPAAPR